MDFFGLTNLGPQDSIKDGMHPEYKEPMCKEDEEQMMKKVLEYSTFPRNIERPNVNIIRLIDCYTGRVNGFAYGSTTRFIKMKRKGVIKPVGPADMYRLPLATSLDYGWFIHDPDLADKTWFKTDPRYPIPASPNSLILDKARKANKYATLF